jgi:hypothetical protein
MLIGYKDKTELELVGHGSGGLDELKQHLNSDKVIVLLYITHVINDIFRSFTDF